MIDSFYEISGNIISYRPRGGGALPIYCSIPMLEPQGYGSWYVLSLLRYAFHSVLSLLMGDINFVPFKGIFYTNKYMSLLRVRV